jgi:hypothetical protein
VGYNLRRWFETAEPTEAEARAELIARHLKST